MKPFATVAIALCFLFSTAAPGQAAEADDEEPYSWAKHWRALEETWTDRARGHLLGHVATYNFEAVWNDPKVRPDLERALGDRLPHLLRNLREYRQRIRYDEGSLVIGGSTRKGYRERAILVVELFNRKVHAGLVADGKTLISSPHASYYDLPSALKEWMHGDGRSFMFANPPERGFDRLPAKASATEDPDAASPMAAWGLYQMTRDALNEIDMIDDRGRWTGRHDVRSEQDFLGSPLAQERALEDFLNRLRALLEDERYQRRLGRTVESARGDFAITEAGLLAAAQRLGVGAVGLYLEYAESRKWKSDIDRIRSESLKATFLTVEARLREFAGVPLYRP